MDSTFPAQFALYNWFSDFYRNLSDVANKGKSDFEELCFHIVLANYVIVLDYSTT